MILAVVLSAIVLFGWSFVSERYFPTANPPVTKIENGREVADRRSRRRARPPTRRRAIRDRAIVLARDRPRVAIRDAAPRRLDQPQGRADRRSRPHHASARRSPPIRRRSACSLPAGTPAPISPASAGPARASPCPAPTRVWQASGHALTPATPVTLSWNNGQGQIFEILLSVDDGYLFTVEQRVINRGAGAIAVRPFALVSRVGASHDPDSWTAHVGPDRRVQRRRQLRATITATLADATASASFDSTRRLARLHRQILAGRGHPDQNERRRRRLPPRSADRRLSGRLSPRRSIVAPGQRRALHRRTSSPAPRRSRCSDHYRTRSASPDRAGDRLGLVRWFMKPIFSLLLWLYAHDRQFRRGDHLPDPDRADRSCSRSRRSSSSSMAAMRAIQPKMKAIQDRHADDRMTMQQEMMKLYKEEKVNPAAGCLPIFLQIPVFYALYKVLMVSVEMRHKPFVLWIQDLSAPDPLTPVNLFGYLPFTPPHFLAHRRAADPARHHDVAADAAQPADARSGPAADFRADAVGADVRHGAISRPACSSTGSPTTCSPSPSRSGSTAAIRGSQARKRPTVSEARRSWRRRRGSSFPGRSPS